MDLIFGYLAGLLTLINPCVLPVLPIVIAASLQADRRAPLALAAGMSVSFVALGLGVASLGPALGVTEDVVSRGAAVVMVAFGLVMLVPSFGGLFARASAGLAARADAGIDATAKRGLAGQAAGGALLGAVWSPCIGPTLGAAIALASQGQDLWRAGAIMVAFALGVSTLILALAYGARAWLSRNMGLMRRLAARSKPVLGAVFVLVGLALFFRLNHLVDAYLIQNLPAWLIDFSVIL
ncbi:thiol:disulfide interchange protein precursor [Aquimixticola soesokkakensis]|uniref:Thiol:disulfide interchange protein n=1 Tax=Aquimixticola soesokkakensis TaxID=1519096 RepID=A0A1Y5TF09_9RHOB|nr:cytochrome c biogenesis CcdA family protein [Aquimixticola soesokkakensis]SLN62728.1 thiol:disulfide interchange protein precursor [Aquimixticola soesokkakensis]